MDDCKTFYGIEKDYFSKAGCVHTAQEIAGQPILWRELGLLLKDKKSEIKAFHEKIGAFDKMRIIFTGAGSSAFIGDALSPLLAHNSGIKTESIHTTDIVSSPNSYLFPDIPTLLVSFARSGKSPESMGAVNYCRAAIKNLYEVAIVCDGTSELSKLTAKSENSYTIVMPEGSCDKGFAMTSSVTCMFLAGAAFFDIDNLDKIVKDINLLSDNVLEKSIEFTEVASDWAKKDFDRIVYIGSGYLKHLAHEASLKMLELTNGDVNGSYESATGFRHGPKSVINDKTVTVHMISDDVFTAKYDIDLLKEVTSEKKQNQILALGQIPAGTVPSPAAGTVPCSVLETGGAIPSLVFCQMLSMFKSLELGVTTDDPSPSGEVNRVVKGVTVYDYK